MIHRVHLAILLTLLPAATLLAGDLTLQLPAGIALRSAVAEAPTLKLSTDGQLHDASVIFKNLLPDTPYDLKLTLSDGTVLQGVNLDWYGLEPPMADAGPLDDDDRKAIQAILDVPTFYNQSEMLCVRGDHDRAAVLTQLLRTREFHSDKGGEIIWRVELYYFKNEHGGWVKIPQVNRLLRRERFAGKAEFDAAIAKLKWEPSIGGIVMGKADRVISLPAPAAAAPAPGPEPAEGTGGVGASAGTKGTTGPTTQPSESP